MIIVYELEVRKGESLLNHLRKFLGLSHFRHQVLSSYQAEYRDGVVFVEYSESPEDFIQGGAAGGNVVYDEDVLIPDG